MRLSLRSWRRRTTSPSSCRHARPRTAASTPAGSPTPPAPMSPAPHSWKSINVRLKYEQFVVTFPEFVNGCIFKSIHNFDSVCCWAPRARSVQPSGVHCEAEGFRDAEGVHVILYAARQGEPKPGDEVVSWSCASISFNSFFGLWKKKKTWSAGTGPGVGTGEPRVCTM